MEAKISNPTPLTGPLKGDGHHVSISVREDPFRMEMKGKKAYGEAWRIHD